MPIRHRVQFDGGKRTCSPAQTLLHVRYAFVLTGVLIIALVCATYLRNRVWADKLSLWTDVVARSPLRSRGYAELGSAYREINRIRESIEMYEKAIALAPNPTAYNNLGNIYRDHGRSDKAIKLFSQAILFFPKKAVLYDNRGLAYCQIGEYNLAIADHTKAIELEPGAFEAYANLGNTFRASGQIERAVLAYTKALEINPYNAALYYLRGLVLALQGRNAESQRDYKQACALGSTEACRKLRRIESPATQDQNPGARR